MCGHAFRTGRRRQHEERHHGRRKYQGDRRGEIGREFSSQDRGTRDGPGEEVGEGLALDLVGHERRGIEESSERDDVANRVERHDVAVEVVGRGSGGSLGRDDDAVQERESHGETQQNRHQEAAAAPDHPLESQVEDASRRVDERQRARRVPTHRATRYRKTDSRSSSGENISVTPLSGATSWRAA